MNKYNIHIYSGDITDEDREYILANCHYIGVDTETTGLNPIEDKLCTIQIAASDRLYVIKRMTNIEPRNLIQVAQNNKVCKIFHHANFDIRFILNEFNIAEVNNVVCTKIAAKILYGIKEKNSLKDLLEKKLGINISKKQQLSDWSLENLTQEQIEYALNDVKYLESLWDVLKSELISKDLLQVAEKCYSFLPTQAFLHNSGIENIFIY